MQPDRDAQKALEGIGVAADELRQLARVLAAVAERVRDPEPRQRVHDLRGDLPVDHLPEDPFGRVQARKRRLGLHAGGAC